MPATALCLSEQPDWRGLEGALYCPGGSVRDAQYAAGRDRFDRLAAAGIGAHAEKRIALLIGNQT